METRTRNILLIAIGAALVLCCCWVLFISGIAAFFIPFSSQERAQRLEVERPVIIVTEAVGARQDNVPAPGGTRSPLVTPNPTLDANREPGPGGHQLNTETLLEAAEMPQRDLRDLALRLKAGVDDIPLVVNATSPSYEVGDSAAFWVENSDTQEHRQITATLRYMTDRVYMWVEEGVNLNLRDLEASAERFTTETYPTNREFFGSEWTPGVDNDVRLTILHSRGLGANIAGYYSSSDQFSRLINPYSNEREMFYISVDRGSAPPNTSFYDGVLAHEFQHMIHWANDRNEDSWVNEGMSELAGHLNGFDTGGAEIAYSLNPDTQLTTWADPSEGNAEHYGASYLFMAYFLERFGEDLTKAVVASQENGQAGFNEALAQAGRPERFDDIFADWLLANYLDQPEAEPRGHFGYSDIDPPPLALTELYRRLPASGEGEVAQYGADYIEVEADGDMVIEFTGSTSVGLVDTQPRGRFAWWSNRGDDSNSTLTRPLDLTGVSAATLTFSLWYDIEEGWDYAYVEVSTDGGEHWQILPGLHTTDENPVGNAFGPGWTGISGGGDVPVWVDEEVDLSEFAGQEVLLRFEYITDDAVNEPGLLLDNIAIPELNYLDDGEGGPADWEAAGWVLTDNQLNQDWLVQVLALSRDSVLVQRLEVGPDGTGQLSLDDPGNLERVVLVVSGLAPVTTERATYEYTIASR